MTDQDSELQALIDAPTDWQQIATDAAWRVEELEADAAKSLATCEDYAERKADEIFELKGHIDNLEATIQRVRDQHKPVAHNFLAKYCQCGQTIPCRTLKALEGDPA